MTSRQKQEQTPDQSCPQKVRRQDLAIERLTAVIPRGQPRRLTSGQVSPSPRGEPRSSADPASILADNRRAGHGPRPAGRRAAPSVPPAPPRRGAGSPQTSPRRGRPAPAGRRENRRAPDASRRRSRPTRPISSGGFGTRRRRCRGGGGPPPRG